MSELEMQSLVDEFLKEVKEKLPEWIKEKKEHKEILPDLEEHIWSKAEELSGTGQPTLESVQSAIEHMGTPASIAKEYKRRGTPKYYITEELWDAYKKVIAGVFGLIIAIVFITQIIQFIFGDFSSILDAISGLQIGLLAAFVVITIIFVALSMEGYFPEDFKSKESTKRVKTKGQVVVKDKKDTKRFVKPGEEIFGGVVGLIIGMIFITQPIPAIMNLIDPVFRLFLQFAGIFMMAEGALDLSRGLIGNRQINAHQVIHGVTIAVKLMSISVVILMVNRPEIFPIIIIDGSNITNIGIAPEFYNLFRGIAGLIIALIILSTLDNVYKIYKLEKFKASK